jgi:PAS domain S-box-containing protein
MNLARALPLDSTDEKIVMSAIADKLILDPEALGRLRRELIWTLGEERSHGLLARVGLSCGMAAALEHPENALIQGLGQLHEKTNSVSSEERVFECANSIEADEHIRFFGKGTREAQCWFLTGYVTGNLSGQGGQGLYALETRCRAKGDPLCRFIAKSRDAWGPEEDMALEHFIEDNVAVELTATRQQLKLTKDRYQNLFEQSSTPIFIVEPDSAQFVDVNLSAEELTGYTKSELLRMTVFDIRAASDHQQTATGLKALAGGESVSDQEVSITRKDGGPRTVAVSSKILDYGGQRVIQTIMRDITDLKVAELKEKDLQNQLLRSERLSSIGRLAAGVAHEIKNPLGAIRNAIYYIKSALTSSPVADNDPQVKEILKLAEEEVDGAVRIIEELLDFSRVVQLIPRKTQINDVLEKLRVHIEIPDNIDVKMDLDPTLPAALVDPDRLIQVFSNIANNAVQSMTSGGGLTIRTRMEVGSVAENGERQEWATVAFEDTGSGIHPQHLKKIFEPLFTTKARGTGLGLAITNNIVEKHGGSIAVVSQMGKGTTFTVKLPLRGPTNTEEK